MGRRITPVLIALTIFLSIVGCGDSFLSDAIYGGRLTDSGNTVNAAVVIEENDSYLEARLYEEIVGENDAGDPIVELFVDIGFDGHISALQEDIEEIRAEGVEVSETLDQNDETILRAAFCADGRTVNVSGRLQQERTVLQLIIVVDNLQMGTLFLERRLRSRLEEPVDSESSDDDDSASIR